MKELLQITNICGYYHKDEIVHNVSLNLHADEIVGLLGKNGSGKTSLFKAIMGSIKHTGDVKVLGLDYYQMPIKKKAQRMSILTQRFEMIEGISVLEFIQLGRYPYMHFLKSSQPLDMFEEVMTSLHIHHLLNKDYMTLSEGQKQLVQIAQLLIQDTDIMLLDEPDSTLDFDNRHLLYQFINHWIKKYHKTALIILHDPLYALNYCQRILLMDEGRIIETILPHQEDCSSIEHKMQKLYPHLSIAKDEKYQQYYILLKEYKKNEK